MEILLVILLLAFLAGLLNREKGDGILDTLSSGCSLLFGLLVLVIALVFLYLFFG